MPLPSSSSAPHATPVASANTLQIGFTRQLWRSVVYVAFAALAPFVWVTLALFWVRPHQLRSSAEGQRKAPSASELIAAIELSAARILRERLVALNALQLEQDGQRRLSFTQWLVIAIATLFAWALLIPLGAGFAVIYVVFFGGNIATSYLSETGGLLLPIVMVVLTVVGVGCFWIALCYLFAQVRSRLLLFFQPVQLDPAKRIQEVQASRRAIVDAFELERQRISRDLHDGAQQYLVATMMKIGEAQLIQQLLCAPLDSENAGALAQRTADSQRLQQLLSEAAESANTALQELRRTTSGLAPELLQDRGLVVAIEEMLTHHDAPISLHVPQPLPQLPLGVATTAYFLISEVVTNALKYAPGAPISILIVAGESLLVSITDQGPGGATFNAGHGLSGLRDRLEAFAGSLELSSPVGGPTLVSARIPLPLQTGESGIAASAGTTQQLD